MHNTFILTRQNIVADTVLEYRYVSLVHSEIDSIHTYYNYYLILKFYEFCENILFYFN